MAGVEAVGIDRWKRSVADNAMLVERAQAAVDDLRSIYRIQDLLRDPGFREAAYQLVVDLADTADYVGVNLILRSRQLTVASLDRRHPSTSTKDDDVKYSFCQYVSASNTPVVITDARFDTLAARHPAYVERGLTSYLGVPLVDQRPVGAVCMANYRPHDWTSAELDRVTELAAQLQVAF